MTVATLPGKASQGRADVDALLIALLPFTFFLFDSSGGIFIENTEYKI